MRKVFDKRSSAKNYVPKDNDNLKKIAEREKAGGNDIDEADIALFNWGTDKPEDIDNLLRDELGCYRLGEDGKFVISADCDVRTDLLIPKMFIKEGLAVDKKYTIKVKKPPSLPAQFEACAKINGVHFEFDKSFIRPSIVDDLQTVEKMIEKYPTGKIIIFGHTDKVGSEGYNKRLSERRALSTYAFITDDADTWEKLYKEENWGTREIQTILKDFGGRYDPGTIDGIYGPLTKQAVRNYQEDKKLKIDGVAGPDTRQVMFKEYMTGKHDVELSADRFMPPEHMGCGEFNFIVPTEEPCADNRRVTFYIFNSERLPRIPCKYHAADPPMKPCKKRLHDNPPSPGFRCSFYNDLARDCDCEHGGTVPVGDRALEIIEVDDHFAPQKEVEEVTYLIRGLMGSSVKIQIRTDSHPDGPIYERELTESEKTPGDRKKLSWDGLANMGGDDFKDNYINPLYAPFFVKLVSDAGLETKELEFKVLYHSIDLEKGTYTQDEKEPGEGERIKWVQYKLNELGYFAGPVDGIKTDQTKRAMKRYTYEIPGMDELDDENNADLIQHLKKGDGKRNLFEHDDCIEKKKNSKIYMDHDYFYHGTTDFNNWTALEGHGDKDKEKLDRFETPIEAKVLLVSKKDADGSGKGVDAPESIGPVDVEWILKDPPEDASSLPSPTTDIPSYGKQYVEKVLKNTAGNHGDADDSMDNCQTANYGARGAKADHFRIGGDLPPFTSRKSGDQVLSVVHADKSVTEHKIGKTGVLLRGSYIAGDNFVLKAQISFDNQAKKDDLVKMHEEFFKKKMKEILFSNTGKLTLWRRHHLSKVITWPAPKIAVNWKEVADSYKIAHCELDSKHTKNTIEAFLPTSADKEEYLKLVLKHNPAMKQLKKKHPGKFKFDAQGMYTADMPSQGVFESAKDYKGKIYKLTETFIKANSYKFLIETANWMRKRAGKTHGPGLILLHANFCRPVTVKKKFLGIPYSSEKYVPGIICIGLPAGVSIISNPMGEKEQDGFLIAHESGHCRYLSHHEIKGTGVSSQPKDHDLSDKNCTMCYPFGIQSRNPPAAAKKLKWNRGDATEPRFCGKCILKLRGWKVSGLTANH